MAMVDAARRRGVGRATTTVSDRSYANDLIRIPVQHVAVGQWHIASKYPEHMSVAVSGIERTLRFEVLHLGVLRRMELSFDDIAGISFIYENGRDGEDGTRLLVRWDQNAPRFFKEAPVGPPVGGKPQPATTPFAPTSDFTSGNASAIDTHVYVLEPGVGESVAPRLQAYGLPLGDEEAAAHAQMAAAAAAEAAAAATTRRPRAYVPRTLNTAPLTPSPRVHAVALMEQLAREISDRQARLKGICPVRAAIYKRVFDELVDVIRADEPRRGGLLNSVRGEAIMTIDAYRTLFESSTAFGSSKLALATALTSEPSGTIDDLEAEIDELREEVSRAHLAVETLEARAAEEAKRSEAKPKDVLDLERSNAMLEQLLEALKPSAPVKEKDRDK